MTDRDDHRAAAQQLSEELERIASQLRRLCNLGDRAERAFEELEQETQERPLCVDKLTTYRVTLGTGGPACGIDFNEDGAGRVWWQDWFSERTYVELDDDAATELAQLWGVTNMIEQDEYAARKGYDR